MLIWKVKPLSVIMKLGIFPLSDLMINMINS